jgi:hypothetical protein
LAFRRRLHHAWVLQPGRVEFLVGNSSADAALTLRQMIAGAP